MEARAGDVNLRNTNRETPMNRARVRIAFRRSEMQRVVSDTA